MKGVSSVNVYNIIRDRFGCDEPIFTSDIETIFPERSRPWIDKTIKTMINNNQLRRFSTGVYYIPRQTIFGESLLNPQKIIAKKYIKNDTDVYGYMSGTSMLNSLGLTTQVPNTITVVSNKEASRGREVLIGNQPVYVLKSSTKITRDNFAVLQFLEVVRLVDLNCLEKSEKLNLEKYIEDNNITLADVSKYCSFFPDYVSKRVLGGFLIGKFAQ